uniref:DH domain-containing protein n=1 Tax=Timema shepardi TaxID=629360 RepID=A0A7R9FZK5_TIMSH|nr:unnamed protein product [Timema shepardi]
MTSSKSFLWSQVSAGNKDSPAPIDVLQDSREKALINGSFLWKTQDLSCRRQDQHPAGSKSIHDSGQRVHTQIDKFHYYNRQGGNTTADIYDDVGCRQFIKAPEDTYDDVGCRQVGKTPDDTYDDVGCRQLQDTYDDPGFEDEPETPGASPMSRVEVTPSTRSSATSGLGSSSEHSLVAADHQGDPELYDEVCGDELTEAVNHKSLLMNKSMLLFSRESPDQAGKRMMSFREDINSGLQDKTQDIARRSSVKSLAERFETLSQGRGSTSALPKNTNNTIIKKKTFLDHKHCILSSHNSQLHSSSSPILSSPISGSLAYPEVRKPPSELLPKPHLQPFEFPIFRLPPLPGTPYLTPSSHQDVHQGSDFGHSMPPSPSTPSASSSGSSSPTASPPLSPVPPTPPPLSTLPSRSSSRRNNFQPFLRVQEEPHENVFELLKRSMGWDVYVSAIRAARNILFVSEPSENVYELLRGEPSENVYELLRGSMELDVYSKEPLYQFYEETSQELAREYICRELESDVEYKPVVPLATTRAVMQQRTLWSQIPEVQESQVLETMSRNQRQLQEAKFEIITSEASYINSLNILKNHFMTHLEQIDEIDFCREDRRILFSDIIQVRNLSEKFLSQLEECRRNDIFLRGIFKVISEVSQKDFKIYVDYCSYQNSRDRTLTRLLQQHRPTSTLREYAVGEVSERLGTLKYLENVLPARIRQPGVFAQTLSSLESSPVCQGLNLQSFLLVPMQRITKLQLLIGAVLNYMERDDEEYEDSKKALHLLNKVVHDCNEGVRSVERMEELMQLSKHLKFDRGIKTMPLYSSSRWLVKKGKLTELKPEYFNSRSIYVFIFNDMLFLARKRSYKQYVYPPQSILCESSTVFSYPIKPGHAYFQPRPAHVKNHKTYTEASDQLAELNVTCSTPTKRT